MPRQRILLTSVGIALLLALCICGLLIIFLVRSPSIDYSGDGVVSTADLSGAFPAEPAPAAGAEKSSPETVRIQGMVLDAYSRPLAGGHALMVLGNVEPPEEQETVPLDDGRFEFLPAKGRRVALKVVSERWGAIDVKPFLATKDLELRFAFEARSSVEGVLVGGRPSLEPEEHLAWLRLDVEGPVDSRDALATPLRLPVHIDPEEGTFLVDGLGPGTFRVVGAYHGKAVEVPFEIERNGDRASVEVDLDASPIHRFVGVAYVGDTTKPLRRTLLGLRVLNRGTFTTVPETIHTNADGEFSFATDRIASGAVLRFTRDPELPFVEISYDPLRPEPYPVIFPDPEARVGIVLEVFSGDPVPFSQVTLRQRVGGEEMYRKRCDRVGEFPATEILPGTYDVTVASGSRSYQLKGVDVPDSSEPLIIGVELGRFVTFVVLSSERSHVVNFAARARTTTAAGEDDPTWVTTGGSLTFDKEKGAEYIEDLSGRVISGLPDDASLEIEVLAPSVGWKRMRLTRAELGENPHLEIVLGPPPTRREFTLIDPQGAPVGDARFEIEAYSEQMRADLKAAERYGVQMDAATRESPILLARKEDPGGRYSLDVYPGEGSEIVIVSPTAGRMAIAADLLLWEEIVVFQGSGGD